MTTNATQAGIARDKREESAEIITFDRRFRAAFVSLNREWIETHFELEPMDLYQLENAEHAILKAGGEIFFVVENGEAVGTCAMIPHGQGYELAKMAVAPRHRGKGYGDLLMGAAIEWARRKGAHEILLLSNTILEPAIRLYSKHGFVRTGCAHPDYKRCNIEMVLKLR